jgi:hypothetical protein
MNKGKTLDEKIKWLESMLKEGKISQECYKSTVKLLEDELLAKETEEIEENLRDLVRRKPHLDVKFGRFYIKLKCPSCAVEGANHSDENVFKYLGKDEKDNIYFECPECYKHLKYNTSNGKVSVKKNLLKHLFRKFRMLLWA